MVRLINEKNVWIVKEAAKAYMQYQQHHTHIVGINEKKVSPAIYVLWHSDQCCIFGINDKTKLTTLISNSLDGEIVSYACASIGLKSFRGSSNRRGAVQSSMKMLEKLKEGENIAIMVDGPRGPYHTVKSGAIKLARMSGVPIYPVVWYSEDITFHRLNSWDKLTFPLGPTRLINLYGEPINVPSDLPDEKIGEYKTIIKNALEDLQAKAPEAYKEAKKQNLWKKLKK